jgi:hypothetical protein
MSKRHKAPTTPRIQLQAQDQYDCWRLAVADQLSSRAGNQARFADQLGVTRQAVHSWFISRRSNPPAWLVAGMIAGWIKPQP